MYADGDALIRTGKEDGGKSRQVHQKQETESSQWILILDYWPNCETRLMSIVRH